MNFKEIITAALNEAKLKPSSKKMTVNVDFVSDDFADDAAFIKKKYRVVAKLDKGGDSADLTGKASDIVKYLTGNEYAFGDDEEVAEFWPELYEK